MIDSKCDHEFVRFCESTDLKDILAIFSNIKKSIGLEVESSTFINIFPILKTELRSKIPYRYEELLKHLQRRSEANEYRMNTAAAGKKVLIIGAGPCGLKMSIEMQYLRNYCDRDLAH